MIDLYLLNLIEKFDSKNSLVKKNILFLQNFILPKFPLSAKDLMQFGFKENFLGLAISEAKKFWARNDFKSDQVHLKKFLKIDF